jgi:hypothetical protein
MRFVDVVVVLFSSIKCSIIQFNEEKMTGPCIDEPPTQFIILRYNSYAEYM